MFDDRRGTPFVFVAKDNVRGTMMEDTLAVLILSSGFKDLS